MRTTVDLPPAVHKSASELAKSRGQSLSATIADLTARGLGEYGQPLEITTNPTTGLPQIRIGRTITAEEVADFLAESE